MFQAIKERWKQELINSGISGKAYEYTKNWSYDISNLQEGILWNRSNDMSIVYGRIYVLSYLYNNQDHELYQNEQVKAIILDALEWMYRNRYGIKEKEGTGWRDVKAFNWWDWEISSPTHLIDTLLMMEPELEEACRKEGILFTDKVKEYLELFHYLVPGQKDYGANRLNYAVLIIKAAILEKDEKTVKKQIAEILDMFEYCDAGFNDGQGFYSDGTYIFHTRHPMNGVYGFEFYRKAVELCVLFDNTELSLPADVKEKLVYWYKTAFMPIVQYGTVIRCMMGREPEVTEEVAEHILSVGDSVLKLSPKDDTIRMFLAGKKQELSHMYYFCDKAVYAKENYTFVISMSSSRIYNYECINSQNMKGWYIGDGMTCLYNEKNRYSGKYWSDVDPYMIPGTTVDRQERIAATIRQSNEYLSSEDFVGGAVLDGRYMAAAMCLESYHSDGNFAADDKFADSPLEYGGPPPKHDCTLKAKKAWFCFEDEIVCLGTDIRAEDGYPVITVVENLPVDNCGGITCEDKIMSLQNIGEYILLDGQKLHYRQENGFIAAYIEHGISPGNQSYAYAVVPVKGDSGIAGKVNTDADMLQSQVLMNSSSIQAVRNGKVTGIVFYEAGDFAGITVDKPCIVMTDGEKFCVADPTHKLNEISVCVKSEKMKFQPQYGESICRMMQG